MEKKISKKVKKIYERAFRQLDNGIDAEEAWNEDPPKERTVSKLLDFLSKRLRVDLSEAEEWFETSSIPYDPEDVIPGKKMTLSMFKIRLGNYLLFKEYQITPSEELEIPDYIKLMRNRYWRENKKLPEKQSGVTLEKIEKKNTEKKIEFREKPVENTTLEELKQEFIVIPDGKSWIIPVLRYYKEKVYQIFHNFGEEVESTLLRKVLKELMESLKFPISDFEYESFEYTVMNKYSEPQNIKFREFIGIVDEWLMKNPKIKNKYEAELLISLGEYYELKCASQYEIGVSEFLKELENFIENYLEKSLKTRESEEIFHLKKGLEEIFVSYAKVTSFLGKKPTFQEIEDNSSTWNLTKFMKFCTDSRLLCPANSKLLSFEQLLGIFKKHSKNTRIMYFQDFIKSLNHISEHLYTPEYDKLNHSNYSDKTSLQKKRILYRFLCLDKPKTYIEQVKKQKLVQKKDFNSYRISSNDSSFNYKFRISPSKRSELEEWRKSRKSSVKVESRLEVKNRIQRNRSGRNFGYARKREEIRFFREPEEKKRSESVEKMEKNYSLLTIDKLEEMRIHDWLNKSKIDEEGLFEKIYGRR